MVLRNSEFSVELRDLIYLMKISAIITKTKLIAQLDSFPEQFSIDQLMERLILLENIEKGKN